MNVGGGIYGILINDSTLTAMLATTTSIYPDQAKENDANPLIVFSEQTTDESSTHDGVSKLDISLVQVDIYAQTTDLRNDISARVRTLLDRYSGIVNSVAIQSIKFLYAVPTVEPYKDKDNKFIFRQSMDFQVRQKL